MTWISNYINTKQLDVNTHPCADLNKLPLKLRHAWVITSYKTKLIWLLIHAYFLLLKNPLSFVSCKGYVKDKIPIPHLKRGILSWHYSDVIMDVMASHITSLTIVYSTAYIRVDQRKLQSSASLAFVRGIHRRPVNSPHKWPVMQKVFPFDDVSWIWEFHNTI